METQSPKSCRRFLSGAALLALGWLTSGVPAFCDSVSIDIGAQPVKVLARPLVGENASFLMSSDRHSTLSPARTTLIKDRLRQMGLCFSRFPYGTMAQNYRWHTPVWNASTNSYDYSSAVNGLKPRVTTQSLSPGSYTWAVNPDGTFNGTLDFDEYIEECHYSGTEPIVVVNLTGDLNMALDDPAIAATGAPGPMTAAQMANEAAEWVRYANVIRGYHVKYWEIGNEQDLAPNNKTLTEADFVTRYDSFVTAMKAVDSSIKVGPGLDSNTGWLDALLADSKAASNLDFIIAHEYLYGRTWANDYGTWSANNGAVLNSIPSVDTWITNHYSSTTGPELFVTECGPISFGSWQEEQNNKTVGLDFHLKTSGKYLECETDGSALVQGLHPDDPIRRMVFTTPDITSTAATFPIYFRIAPGSAGGSTTQYLAVGSTTSSPIAFNGTDQDDYSQWRLRGGGSTWYLESRHFPGYYLAVASSSSTALTLTTAENSSAHVSFDSTVLSSTEIATGSKVWSHPTTSLLLEEATKRCASVSGSTISATTQVGQNAPAFSFQIRNVDSNGTVKIYANIGSSSPGYLEATGSASNTGVDTLGTGTDLASEWVFHYDPTDDPTYTQFRFESKLYPGKYLMVDTSNGFVVTANGSSTPVGTSLFTLQSLPKGPATTYPTKPAYDQSPVAKDLNGDFYKSLVFSEMLLESLTVPHVGAMIHWNTQYIKDGASYGVYGNVDDSLAPSTGLELTPNGIVEQLLNTYVSGTVVYATTPGTVSPLRTYACFDKVTGELAVVVLNKSQQAQTLTLSFAGASPFVPAAYYDAHTYATSVIDSTTNLPDPEDLYPTVSDQTNLALPAGNQFTIDPLCLKVIVLTDPSHAGGPLDTVDLTQESDIRFTLNSVAMPSVWVNTMSSAKAGVSAPASYNSTAFLDLTNFFMLSQPGGANTYQIASIPTTSGGNTYFTYSSSNRTSQVTIGGASGSPNSEWTWTPKVGATTTYVQLFTNLVPTASMRANLTAGTGEMPIDTNGGTGNWAQYLWNYAPTAPVGYYVIIRSVSNGNMLSAPLTGTMAAVFSPTPAGPDTAGNLGHKFKVAYVGNGLVTLCSQLSQTNFLKAGATTTAAVTVAGLGNETDQSSYWRPLFSTVDGRMYLQSAKTGGFLTVESDDSVDTSTTSPSTLPGSPNTCYWVFANFTATK